MAIDWRNWTSPLRGARAGMEVVPEGLRVAVMRGRTLRGTQIIATAGRPAADWGADVNALLASCGAAQEPLMLVLPEDECVVRTVALPGVPAKDRDAALALQLDTLSPDPEPVAAWLPIAGTDTVLVGVTRPEVIRRWSQLMQEAGLELAGCTLPAALIPRQRRPLIAFSGDSFYAESATGHTLWASGVPASMVRAQMRLGDEVEPEPLEALLPGGTLAAAAAVSSRFNLLPSQQRVVRHRWGWVPTAVLASLAALSIGALWAFPAIDQLRLMSALRVEIARLEPAEKQSAAALRSRQQLVSQIDALRAFRGRTRADLGGHPSLGPARVGHSVGSEPHGAELGR
ncbi:MAG: hypothetical protein NTV70_19005 [Acidobacteria bacterium]|nr:hypothetical protein [Acidobacteriota bacterium]